MVSNEVDGICSCSCIDTQWVTLVTKTSKLKLLARILIIFLLIARMCIKIYIYPPQRILQEDTAKWGGGNVTLLQMPLFKWGINQRPPTACRFLDWMDIVIALPLVESQWICKIKASEKNNWCWNNLRLAKHVKCPIQMQIISNIW